MAILYFDTQNNIDAIQSLVTACRSVWILKSPATKTAQMSPILINDAKVAKVFFLWRAAGICIIQLENIGRVLCFVVRLRPPATDVVRAIVKVVILL
jgi:hypothetical protein